MGENAKKWGKFNMGDFAIKMGEILHGGFC